jgi:hypothetical protein
MLPKVGDRIELIEMDREDDGRPDPDPIEPSSRGTVDYVSEPLSLPGDKGLWRQIGVKWDNGRTLSLLTGKDRFRILQEG